MSNIDTQESEDLQLENLIRSWGFDEQILSELKAESITLKRLQYLSEGDLAHLFRNFKLGEKVEFRHHLLEWRHHNGYNDIQRCDTISLDTKSMQNNENWNPSCGNQSLDSSSSSFFQDCYCPRKLDLHCILNAHPSGDYVERLHNESGKLNDAARKILVDAIVTWHIKNKIKIGRNEFKHISVAIENKFNDDKDIYYNTKGLRAYGRLHDKYYNTLKIFKKAKKSASATIEVNECPKESNIDKGYENEAEIERAHDWLKIYTEPWNDVQENWRKTYKKRREEILFTKGHHDKVIDILQNWKLFSHSLGHNLVAIDFNYILDESPSIFDKWDAFKIKILPILNEKVKDPTHLPLLEKINSKHQGSDQLIALLLHVLLRPSIKRKLNNTKRYCRSTIKDSQLSFLVHVITFNDVQNALQQLKNSLYNRGETLQPIIIAVGRDVSEAKFFVYFDDIKYELPSFLSSLDICFKVFHVLNLKYPSDSFDVWIFIQKYFYCMNLEEDVTSSNVLCLINDLK